jgi:nucleotide-binding universal stress UspA family protein
MVNVSSVFIRRRYGDKLAYGYLTPFFPAVPVLAVIIQLVLASYMLHFSADVLLTAGVWLGGGALIYAFYSRRNRLARIPTPVVVEERPVRESGYAAPPVVLPVARPQGSDLLVRTSAAIAQSLDRHVLLLHVVTVPEQLSIRAGNDLVPEAREEMADVLEAARRWEPNAELLIRLAHNPAVAIVKTLEASGADFCVLGWRGSSRGANRVLGSNLDEVLRAANCNFVVMQDLGPERTVRRILLPAANPTQAELAFAVAYAVARTLGADAIHVLTLFEEGREQESLDRYMVEIVDALSAGVGDELPRWPSWTEPVSVDGVEVSLEATRTPSALNELEARSLDYDLMVMGAGPGGPWRREVLGRFTWALANRSACPVVAVKRRAGVLHFSLQSFFDFFQEEDAVRDRREDGDGTP